MMERERISLSSGTWAWQVIDPEGRTGSHTAGARPAGIADPDPEADSGNPVLLLQDPESPNDWMTRELPPAADPQAMKGEELEYLARHPDLRQVTGPDGETWSLRTVPPPRTIYPGKEKVDQAPRRIQASKDGAPARLVQLPEGKALGEMQREEILALL